MEKQLSGDHSKNKQASECMKHSSQELNLRLKITLSRVNKDLWVLLDFFKGKKQITFCRGKDRQNYLLTFHCPVKFVPFSQIQKNAINI